MLIEGPHLVAAALDAGAALASLLVSSEWLEKPEIAHLVGRARIAPTLLAAPVFRHIAEAETPQGIAAELAIPGVHTVHTIEGSTVFLEGVQDAGNAGAIVRTAAAFGVARVVLDRKCADPWSPKVLRAGMGGHFRLAVEQADDFLAELASFSGTLVATVARDGRAPREVDVRKPGWLFGGEGAGLSPAALALAREQVTIPMTSGAESLNVAAAAAIVLYEAFSRGAAGS